MLFASVLAAIAIVPLTSSAHACDIPAPVQTTDPPGYYYDNAAGYA